MTPDGSSPRPWSVQRILRILFWAALTVLLCVRLGPEFLGSLRPERTNLLDFVQEWTSARNLFHGTPVYAHQEEPLRRYLGFERPPPNDPLHRQFLGYNAHPPTAVLLAVPVAWLDYPDAFLCWNLLSLAAFAASLWLMVRQLQLTISPWSLLPLVCFLLVCMPFRSQVNLGQLNLVLLLLLTGVWAAERSGRPGWAGLCLGAAAAIKLFPAFLFLFFIWRRQWRLVLFGIASLVGITLLTAAILGPQAYDDYRRVAPQVADAIRGSWINASLAGFWDRLFHPNPDNSNPTEPVWRSPLLARLGTLLSDAAMVTLLAWGTRPAPNQSRAVSDSAFGLALVTMLLVSPATWDHGFLLLTLPVVLLWLHVPRFRVARLLFYALVVVLCLNMSWVCQTVIPRGFQGTARPLHSLTALSLPCYALLGMFALLLWTLRRQQKYAPGKRVATKAGDCLPAASAAPAPANSAPQPQPARPG